jgi:two-component system, cell cycle sensor histidine kinase and response regulator CckA
MSKPASHRAEMDTYDVAELAQTLFEEAGDALFLFDPESEQIRDTNPMAQRLSGFSRQQLLRLDIHYLFRSDAPGGLGRLRSAFRKTGVFHSQEGHYLRQHQDGRWLPVNLSITRLHTESEVLGLITARDMTEHHQAQALLKRKEAELRRVLDSVSDCLWSAHVDPAGRWTMSYCSSVIEKITGRTPDYFFKSHERWYGIIHPEDLDRAKDFDRKIFQSSGAAEVDFRILHADDGVRWVRESVRVHREPSGARRLDGVLTDVSERRLAEEALRASEAKYRTLIENLDQCIFLKDQTLRFAAVNRNFCAALGRLTNTAPTTCSSSPKAGPSTARNKTSKPASSAPSVSSRPRSRTIAAASSACSASSGISPTSSPSSRNFAMRRRWTPSASSPAASPMISTTSSWSLAGAFSE